MVVHGFKRRGQRGLSLLKLNVSLDNSSPHDTKLFKDDCGCEKWTRTLSELTGQSTIDIVYHHIRDWVKLGKLLIVPVSTDLQLADAMTKPLPRQQHDFLLEKHCGGT